MTKPFSFILLATSLASCQRSASPPEPGTTLVGSWRLTTVQCNYPAGQPVPDELLTFDAGRHFQLLHGDKLAAEGTYATGQAPNCSGGTAEPKLTLRLPPTPTCTAGPTPCRAPRSSSTSAAQPTAPSIPTSFNSSALAKGQAPGLPIHRWAGR